MNPHPSPDIDAALAHWRAAYLHSLQAPRGWWSVTGLSFFAAASSELGRANPELGLPAGTPDVFARVVRTADGAHLVPLGDHRLWLNGAPLTAAEAPVRDQSVLSLGASDDAPALVFLQRGERFGVRVFNPAQGHAHDPRQLAWFAPSAVWRLAADWTPAAEGETLPIINMLGDVSEAPLAGRVHLSHAGASHTLIARPKGDGALLLHFRDATSGKAPTAAGTYGAGRFLHVEAPQEGRVWLDFNLAHHPPCGHTPHATCPLPPLANYLPFALTAGERSA